MLNTTGKTKGKWLSSHKENASILIEGKYAIFFIRIYTAYVAYIYMVKHAYGKTLHVHKLLIKRNGDPLSIVGVKSSILSKI